MDFFGPAGRPAAVAAFIWAVFELAEKVTSKQVKAALTVQLKTLKAEDAAAAPAGAHELFNRVFGQRQFSIKCVIRSVVFSLVSILIVSIIAFPHRRPLIDLLRNDPFDRSYFLMWVPVSLIPDFLNLYKTRIIIKFLNNKKTFPAWRLISIICLDFIWLRCSMLECSLLSGCGFI